MPKIAFTMEARKLLYTAMALAPAVLMAGIGVHARTYVDPFDWPAVESDNQITRAYIPLVVRTRDLLASRENEDRSAIRAIAEDWSKGGRSGELKPLVPIGLEEVSMTGNKSKILDANNHLARRLIGIADHEIQSGNYDRASKDLILAADASICLKYSNFLSLYRISLAQNSILRRIEMVYPFVNVEARSRLKSSMKQMICDEQELSRMASRTERLIRAETRKYNEIHQLELISHQSAPEVTLFERSALAKGEEGATTFDPDTIEFARPSLTFEAQQCVAADQRNRLMIKKIMSLSPHSTS